LLLIELCGYCCNSISLCTVYNDNKFEGQNFTGAQMGWLYTDVSFLMSDGLNIINVGYCGAGRPIRPIKPSSAQH